MSPDSRNSQPNARFLWAFDAFSVHVKGDIFWKTQVHTDE